MVKNFVNVPEKWKAGRLSCLAYWFPHWLAVNVVAVAHHCWSPRFLLHDADKPWKLFVLGRDYDSVKKEHQLQAHHLSREKLQEGKADLVQAACDWQASGYTKPDSLLDARETLEAYHSYANDAMLPVLDRYGF